jgi:hypothetical protein
MKTLHAQGNKYGAPTYIAFIEDDMWFYPTPDKDYELKLRYTVLKEV